MRKNGKAKLPTARAQPIDRQVVAVEDRQVNHALRLDGLRQRGRELGAGDCRGAGLGGRRVLDLDRQRDEHGPVGRLIQIQQPLHVDAAVLEHAEVAFDGLEGLRAVALGAAPFVIRRAEGANARTVQPDQHHPLATDVVRCVEVRGRPGRRLAKQHVDLRSVRRFTRRACRCSCSSRSPRRRASGRGRAPARRGCPSSSALPLPGTAGKEVQHTGVAA